MTPAAIAAAFGEQQQQQQQQQQQPLEQRHMTLAAAHGGAHALASPSLHHNLLRRELGGGGYGYRCGGGGSGAGGSAFRQARRALRPSVEGFACDAKRAPGSGIVPIEPRGTLVPPFALRFAKTAPSLLAIADEEGFVTVVDTNRALGDGSTVYGAAGAGVASGEIPAIRSQYECHHNAVFDITWLSCDTRLLTASGDQSVKLWDAESCTSLGLFKGHKGSVKSVTVRPSCEDTFATGSRDGEMMLWDMRAPAHTCSRSARQYVPPVSRIRAHPMAGKSRRRRRGSLASDSQQSVTQVMFLRDDSLLASAGAADGTVKLWDVRSLKKPVAALGAASEWIGGSGGAADGDASVGNNARLHGVCSMAQDDGGGRMVVARANDACYVYDVLRPENGPISRYAGASLRSFYIKTDFAPGGSHFVTGSADKRVHIFEVDSPEDGPYTLQGHTSEVTAVAWCQADVGKLATAADDGTVRVWSLQRNNEACDEPDGIEDPLRSAAKRGVLVKRHRRAMCAAARSMRGGRRVFGEPTRLDFAGLMGSPRAATAAPADGLASNVGNPLACATASDENVEGELAAPAAAWAAAAGASVSAASVGLQVETPMQGDRRSPSPSGTSSKRARIQTDIASFFRRP